MKRSSFYLFIALGFASLAPAQARNTSKLEVWVEGKVGTLVKVMSVDNKQLIIAPETIEVPRQRGCSTAKASDNSTQNCLPLVVLSSRSLQMHTTYQLVCTENRGTGAERAKIFSTDDHITVYLRCPGYTPK